MPLSFKKYFLTFLTLAASLFIFMAVKTLNNSSKNTQHDIAQLKSVLKVELREEIKKEVQQEFDRNIDSLVREKVEQEVGDYLAKNKDFTDKMAQNVNVSDAIDKAPKDQETLAATITKMLRDYIDEKISASRHVSDKELERYVASGDIEPPLKIGKGYSKSSNSSEFRLASAKFSSNSKGKKKPVETNADVVAGEVERAESLERVMQQKGSILLPKGTLQVEPSFVWSHFSSNRIQVDGLLLLDVFAIGQISTDTIKRDVFIETTSLKYGLLNNLQAEIKIPFKEEHDRIVNTVGKESTNVAGGIGDIELGLSRQVGWEHGLMPDLVAGVNLKTTTGKDPYNKEIGLGSGHWTLRGSLVAAKSSDPAVIFGSLSYSHSFPRYDIDNFGDVIPGDTIGYSIGTAIALSYQTAINFSFDHSITLKTERNNATVAGSFLNVADFRSGLSWSLSERASVDFGVTIGLTNDAPDVTVDIRFPYTF